MSEPLPPNPDEQPPAKPPIPLDYNSIPEPSIIPAFFGGFAWGFLGTGFVVWFSNEQAAVHQSITVATHPAIANQSFDPTAFVEIGIAVACALTVYFLYQSNWRKRKPFLLGWLAGASGAFLTCGICWAAGR